ncbi:low molecular weight protein arginine phosphatase [Salsuginibacillus kocurii]|uniref:low molecular weight protein arginine phosphatase n=1 Tax=Salsuginibacillus kocurii TaxID=427078 RepID=UPI00037E0F19|nr:low molecular weight protein arginine phosphatase [Salsuginibacillus kocurii]
MKHILIVCTGNTCRSPMAQAILDAKNEGNLEVRSAGISAVPGMDPAEEAKAVLQEKGIDVKHSSQPVDEQLIEWADVILTMTRTHLEMLKRLYPSASSKAFTLKTFVAGEDTDDVDISDPIGGGLGVYRATATELERLLDQALAKIKEDG